jgi:KaiC/GvpD/RAD55 family RecA-like ATPase
LAQTKVSPVLWANCRNFVTDDLFELEQHTIKSPGLRWRLACLNLSLGPIRAGDFGFVFARPESGKTTFLADQITFFAEQATRPIVWFNNEEQGEKVRLRTYQACLGLTQDQVWAKKDKNLLDYRTRTKGLIRIYDDASIHKSEVEAIVAELSPELVVFDQIDKIKGFDADRPDIVYGRIYQWARELAKRGAAIIGICQSDGGGEGVRWLTMSHVAEAKTSKQAEADWILGIGRSNESGTEEVRFFNISKNKLLGDDKTDPNLRHGRFEVYMRPQIARYEDLE